MRRLPVLPTFVIGLREGLAVAICVAFGIVLDAVSEDLPQKQQETLESVIALIAVGFVTYMIVWMKRHSHELKGHLEDTAAGALAAGSAWALIVMAFLAVIREGFETSVFLVATFQSTGNATKSALGAVLGIVVAIVLGYLIFKG